MYIRSDIGDNEGVRGGICENICLFIEKRLETLYLLRCNNGIQLDDIGLDFVGHIDPFRVRWDTFNNAFCGYRTSEGRNQEGTIGLDEREIILGEHGFDFLNDFLDRYIVEVNQ